ncbi:MULTISPECIES: DUF1579 domain-containing protein [Asticcacaulis]|uniref:DUF1579 domain-containing protein n=1 Tax=Asticcacaulis TaxID=76890 RepID=UPI001AE1F52D|nr:MULTISPECIES: DUF1579 domain-containing protein [Asticcacaulis]MBP2160718.1 hypothetical protein [Asticcacaulis solisilvae]MDR6801763.1 hypothetical protein [Asticcacaulis sp. BE141]
MLKTVLAAGALIAAAIAMPAFAGEAGVNAAAMAKFDAMKGVWKGEAKGTGPGGVPFNVTQTERIGPLLGGDVLVVEGTGYLADGKIGFNAFGVISWNTQTQGYEFRTYNAGRSGTFKMTPTDTGAVWEIPAGPNANIVSTITIKDGTWHEVQQYVTQGQPARTVVEMNLKRVGDSEWPAAGAVKP